MSDQTIEFRPVKVHIEGQSEARLLFVDDALAAVVIKLDLTNDGLAGKWYVEVGFNHFDAIEEQTFESLDSVTEWVRNNPEK